MTLRLVSVAAATSLVLVACGGDGGEATTAAGPTTDGVRVVEVGALDELAFDPASIEVSVGETVRFVVTNPGSTDHEFVLGDEEVQKAHDGSMGEMGHGSGMDHGSMDGPEPLAAVALAPGATEEVEVTFDTAGEILYGCHLPGHYEGGMVGTITVS